jgi:DNA polymerase-3 subunit alpha
MEQIPTYIKYKHNPEQVQYLHPELENILNVTYGCMLYQEQVMQIVRDLAGYSLARADLVRKAMGKKKVDVMKKERQNFIYGIVDENGKIEVDGAIRRGVSEELANKIFDQMMDFASYAFNKAHSTCYAFISYQTAWLKHYYPREFVASLINSIMGSSEKVAQYIEECKTMGIKLLPPDINKSKEVFIAEGEGIRFGLGALKNVGITPIKAIVKEREENGPFQSFDDFGNRLDSSEVNKRCVESLIQCGTFDSLKVYRSQLMAIYEKVLDGIGDSKKKN